MSSDSNVTSSSEDNSIDCSSVESGDFAAKPQLLKGRGDGDLKVWPEHWGITLEQVRELLEECKASPTWSPGTSMYEFVNDYVIPKTRGTGLGYALLRNQQQPRRVSIMVSHAWRENVEDFVETLERSVSHTDVLFICSLALYQCEDGLGPSVAEQVGSKASESPFRRVLEAISRDGRRSVGWSCGPALECLPSTLFVAFLVVFSYPIGAQDCIPTPGGMCAYGTQASYPDGYLIATYCMLPMWEFRMEPIRDSYRWMLPTALVLLGLSLLAKLVQRCCPLYGGRMVAVPNHETDLYSRLWCMYEMYAAQSMGVPVRLANTLARAGACKCCEASCSSREDERRILADIEAVPLRRGVSVLSRISKKDGCRRVDSAIWRITGRAQWTAWLLAFQWIVPFAAVRVAMTADEGELFEKALTLHSYICVGIYSMACAGLAVFAALYAVVVLNRGRPPLPHLYLLSGCLIGFSMGMRALELSLQRRPATRRWGILNQPPLHHCFTYGVLCGGVSVLVLTVLARVVPRRLLPSPGLRRLIIASALVLALGGVTVHGVSLPAADQYYPMAVWYLLFRLAPVVGFPSFMWVMAARWGVELAGAAEQRRRGG